MQAIRIILLLLLLPYIGISQLKKTPDYKIDWQVQNIKAAAPEVLAKALTKDYQTDIEKTWAIFSWITTNITYTTNRYKRITKTVPIDDDTGALKSLDERVAITVLERGEAVCDGFARLFKTLCDYAGLQAEVIHGYARSGAGRQTSFRPNHSWNAIRIDGHWQLLDVTWAAGFIDLRNNQYISRLDEKYFLTPPEIFIQDHYPEDHRWTLISEPPLHKEYKRSPFIFTAYHKNRIVDFYPGKGIIEANAGDTLIFKIKTSYSGRSFFVTPFYFSDEAETIKYQYTTLTERKSQEPETITCTYIVDQRPPEWLYVIYNGEQVMRYRFKTLAPARDVALNNKE